MEIFSGDDVPLATLDSEGDFATFLFREAVTRDIIAVAVWQRTNGDEPTISHFKHKWKVAVLMLE